MLQVSAARAAQVRTGVRVEMVSLTWMFVEAIVAIGAGVAARSLLLTAFGFDSVVELVAGGVVLWRLRTENAAGPLERVERAEVRASWVTGCGLVVLCLYIVVTAALSLGPGLRPERSYVGLALALIAVVSMPVLARVKRKVGHQIDSAALRADAACSVTCAYIAGALLVGLALNAILGWWWADSIGALALLYWLVPETRAVIQGAREGRLACGCA